MELLTLKPKQSLNKAYLKEKLVRTEVNHFKETFSTFLKNTANNQNDEEHLKSQVAYFLRDTWFKHDFHINPIEKNDLVIHIGKSPADPIGVIIEVKSLTNKAEMLSATKPNAKALHELVLYYFKERIEHNNNRIKYLIATNIDSWFIFDANEFDKKIYRNSKIKKIYETKQSDKKDNPWFYDELKKHLEQAQDFKLEVTTFNLRDFEKVVYNQDEKDDKKLIPIYKLLTPVHLLKIPFANDSNSLQPKFYEELLHIIGLKEEKEGSKKLIKRKKEGERDAGSLLENTIVELDSHDKISRLSKPSAFGENYQDRLFNVALELVITWVNRILFLKLLEAQLYSYHKGDKNYKFLNKEKIKDFDDLDKLFFRVLAKKPDDRSEAIQTLFGKVPYLNSSLFEPTELEHETLFIHGLEDRVPLPIINASVLKENNGKSLKGSLDTIDYLFAFLDAYDFSSEGSEEIQEDNKTLINASVLGLIFEKINGYKDGSFFTPGFITMYMCRETIRRAVVQKFNEAKGWDVKEYEELYNKIENTVEANTLINSLKICDPAVGSGHFLVSALNELIAIKSDLKILCDKQGRRLKEYEVLVENDELIVTDEEGDPFEYNTNSKESQRIQETLFHEKQTIIENCLFGVDINPNSVKICRLRLWIELLKNAYYKDDVRNKGLEPQLETLPNIDINIKTGNSLISRFALDADLKQALKGTKWNINDYKIAVSAYKSVSNKDQKKEIVKLIEGIKENFSSKFYNNSQENKDLSKLRGQLTNLLTTNIDLFGTKRSKKDLELEQKRLELSITKKEEEIGEIKSNKIYDNAFEWRFEFPEILNNEGDFVGFDVVIGNPPYGVRFENAYKNFINFNFSATTDIYTVFFEKSNSLIKENSSISFITPVFWLDGDGYINTRKYIYDNLKLSIGITLPYNVFADAYVDTGIFIFKKAKEEVKTKVYSFKPKEEVSIDILKKLNFSILDPKSINLKNGFKLNFNISVASIISKVYSFENKINDISDSVRGILASKDQYFNIENGGNKKVFVGKLDRYEIDKDFQFINYDENLKEKPKNYSYFKDERILVRRIVNRQFRIMASITNEEFVTKKDIYTFRSTNIQFSNHYLLAILNSKLISFIKVNSSLSAKKDDFTQLTLSDIRNISIPPIYDDLYFKTIINQILEQKNSNPNSNTHLLEQVIDQMVYKLYELTGEEIKIVEEGFNIDNP